MKKMIMLAFVCTAATALYASGCGAQLDVVTEGVKEKINTVLGEMKVKRAEIDRSMAALKDGVKGLRKAKIKAQVKHDQLERKVEPINRKIANIDKSLVKLREHLASDSKEAVEIAGKSYSQEELQKMAGRIIEARKNYVTQQSGFQKSQEGLNKVIATLERRQQEYEEKVSRLDTQLAEIDSKQIALKAMQDASSAMGESEETLLANVGDLEDKVNDLFADVEVELRSEDEKWNASSTDNDIDAVDAFISGTQDPVDVLNEIDSILGEAAAK